MDAARLGENEGETGGRADEADGDEPRARGGAPQHARGERKAEPAAASRQQPVDAIASQAERPHWAGATLTRKPSSMLAASARP